MFWPILSLLLLLTGPGLSLQLLNWPLLSFETEVAIRAQRDTSYPIPIDQTTGFGVSLSSLLFNQDGYTNDTLPEIDNMLSSGARVFAIDLYWNNFTSKWQLCPGPYPINGSTSIEQSQDIQWNGNEYKCQPSFTMDTIMNQFRSYFGRTNTNMNANVVHILLGLRQFQFPKTMMNTTTISNKYQSSGDFAKVGNSSLTDSVSGLGSLLFTPNDLNSFRNNHESSHYNNYYNLSSESFPTLQSFIFNNLKRSLAIVVEDEITQDKSISYNHYDKDKDNIFFSGTDIDTNFVSITNSLIVSKCLDLLNNQSDLFNGELGKMSKQPQFNYIFDNEHLPFTNNTFHNLVQCGFSPLLSSESYTINDTITTSSVGQIINHFLPLSFWSWAQGEPGVDNDKNKGSGDNRFLESQSNVQENNQGSQQARKCVTVTENGWKVDNCYQKLPYACKNEHNPNKWIIKDDNHRLYFQASDEGRCPKDHKFGVPNSNIEMLALKLVIKQQQVEYPVWIDLNDITVTNCFVTGGPYAQCPYQRTVTTKALAGLVAPTAVLAIVIIVLVFLEKAFRVNPVQTNRKRHWKKRINEFNKNEYEGVPS